MGSSKPIGAGKSSFEHIDVEVLFGELNLTAVMTVLDLTCGRGAYSLAASERVGPNGTIFAVDLWEDKIAISLNSAGSSSVLIIV